MCLIVDANTAGLFLGEAGPVRDWLGSAKGKPRLVVGGLLTEELGKLTEVRRLLVELNRAGRLRSFSSAEVQTRATALKSSGDLRSNDSHVIALAQLSGARTLATHDTALMSDFRNKRLIDKPRGSILSNPANPAHLRLLRHTHSCGIG